MMVTRYNMAFLSTSLFVVVMALLLETSEGQQLHLSSYSGYQAEPRFFNGWGAPRGFWSRARSIVPRLADVASEAATVLAVPALAVLAISAFWPHRRHYRSKREVAAGDVEGTEAPIDELSEHMMNIFYAAMESDECLQRIACEVGAASRSFKSGNIASLVSALGAKAPTKYGKLFEKFKFGMNAEKCEALGCSLLDQ